MKYLKKEHMLIISIKLLFAFTTGFVGGCVFRTVGVPHSLTMPIGYIFGFILCGYLK